MKHTNYLVRHFLSWAYLVILVLPIPVVGSEDSQSPVVMVSSVLVSSFGSDGVPVTDKQVTISILDTSKLQKHIADSPMGEWSKFIRRAVTDQNGYFSFNLLRDDFLDEPLDIAVYSEFDSRKLIRLTGQQGRDVFVKIEATTGDIDLGKLTFLDFPRW